jgi:hypothetical protein
MSPPTMLPAAAALDARSPVRESRPISPLWLAHACTMALIATALVRAVSAPTPPPGERASDALRRETFAQIAAEEPSMRAAAAHEFPGDAWSQDDDFHQREQKMARSVAAKNGVRLGDVLRALDDGLREGWPPAPRVHLSPGVPPCRPRLSY